MLYVISMCGPDAKFWQMQGVVWISHIISKSSKRPSSDTATSSMNNEKMHHFEIVHVLIKQQTIQLQLFVYLMLLTYVI